MSPLEQYIKDEIQSRAAIEDLKRLLSMYDKRTLIAMVDQAERDAQQAASKAASELIQRLSI